MAVAIGDHRGLLPKQLLFLLIWRQYGDSRESSLCMTAVPTSRKRLILLGFLGGGAERDRTADLVNAIHALSQLSYGPEFLGNRRWPAGQA